MSIEGKTSTAPKTPPARPGRSLSPDALALLRHAYVTALDACRGLSTAASIAEPDFDLAAAIARLGSAASHIATYLDARPEMIEEGEPDGSS
jgi:hypothetical protein